METFPPFDPCFVPGVQRESNEGKERKEGVAAGTDANLQEHSIFPSSRDIGISVVLRLSAKNCGVS